MTTPVEMEQVKLSYGRLRVLDGVTLRVMEGECLGLVGANGSGKTALLHILAGLAAPSSGRVRVCGLDLPRRAAVARRKVGFLPEEFGVYPSLTVAEYLDFFARCYGMPGQERKPTIETLLQLVDLHHLRNTEAARLSRGLRRRLGLARALLHSPPVLLLDDPFADLDDGGRAEFAEVLRELREMGTAVVVTSRRSEDVVACSTSMALLESGRISWLREAEVQGSQPAVSLGGAP